MGKGDADGRTGALAAALRAGEPGALEAWFEAEHGPVRRLCFGFLADPWEADDAAQDAMLHLHDRIERWDGRRSYVTWRNVVVANLCRDRLRREETRRRAEEAALDARPEPSSLSAAGAAEDLRETLRRALGALSPREREVFVLRDLEERPAAEVATTLGITAGAVRSLSMLARRRLRGLFTFEELAPDTGGRGGVDG